MEALVGLSPTHSSFAATPFDSLVSGPLAHPVRLELTTYRLEGGCTIRCAMDVLAEPTGLEPVCLCRLTLSRRAHLPFCQGSFGVIAGTRTQLTGFTARCRNLFDFKHHWSE